MPKQRSGQLKGAASYAGRRDLFNEDFQFSGLCSETKRLFNKSSNARGILPFLRKVDAAHYEWSITYHYQRRQRSFTLDKLYQVFHRHSARLRVSFDPRLRYSLIGTCLQTASSKVISLASALNIDNYLLFNQFNSLSISLTPNVKFFNFGDDYKNKRQCLRNLRDREISVLVKLRDYYAILHHPHYWIHPFIHR